MTIHFTKMHGLGNDFVVIDAVSQQIEITPDIVRRLSNRYYGVGCDQVLLIEKPITKGVDFFYRIFNHDGKEAMQCGNGARCIARFIHEHGLSKKKNIAVETLGGKIELRLSELSDNVTVNMGKATISQDPLLLDCGCMMSQQDIKERGSNGGIIEASIVSIGNSHVILHVKDVDSCDIEKLNSLIVSQGGFNDGVNVELMQILSKDRMKIRVYERGVGETFACGSGACAAFVVGKSRGLVGSKCSVIMPGGELALRLSSVGCVWMTGPAVTVFDGVFYN